MVACMFEMLANAGQEMDSARDCKYKLSINLVIYPSSETERKFLRDLSTSSIKREIRHLHVVVVP